jgi:hypothetical protein
MIRAKCALFFIPQPRRLAPSVAIPPLQLRDFRGTALRRRFDGSQVCKSSYIIHRIILWEALFPDEPPASDSFGLQNEVRLNPQGAGRRYVAGNQAGQRQQRRDSQKG